jgi:hypothetical protein
MHNADSAGESPITPDMRAAVGARLGREPRGLRAVPVTDAAGNPMVIRVASLVDGRPFPTLFWLIDPALRLRIDRAEAAGLIAQFQAQVDASEALRAAMRGDHLAHIALRDACLTAGERAALARGSFSDALRTRGIGGIADFSRIRCLHTWYAAHLVVPNTIGRLLDAHWQREDAASG